MRPISRHLPPNPPSRLSLLGKLILFALFSALLIWAWFQPLFGALVIAFVILCWLGGFQEEKRIQRIRKLRRDTICDFRRAFDVRRVDPYILRATYQELGRHLDPKAGFPLRATDHFENDLKIDDDDLDDLACNVAKRLNYDITTCRLNPLYGKVNTVHDFVMFFTHTTKPTGPK